MAQMSPQTRVWWDREIQPRLDRGLKNCYFCGRWFPADGTHRMCTQEYHARETGFAGGYGNEWVLNQEGR